MKSLEINGLGLQEMSVQEQKQTDGGNPLVLIALGISLLIGLFVFIKKSKDGESLT